MPLDAALVGALHVEYLQKRDLVGEDRPHHSLFQTSTIEALLEGNYDGDVTFAELGERGYFGLGTCRLTRGELRVDREADLRLELPPEVSLPVPGGRPRKH